MNRFVSAAVVAIACVVAAPAVARAGDIVTVTFDGGFSPTHRAKLEEAVKIANRVLASPEFKAKMAALPGFTYTKSSGSKVHSDLTSRTYSVRFVGVEKWAFSFFGIRKKSAMIAATSEGSGEITFNTLRMDEFAASSYAGTIAHELTHVCGYSHNGNRPTSSNLRSAPYKVGELVEELAGVVPAAPVAPAAPAAPVKPTTPATKPVTPAALPPAQKKSRGLVGSFE